MTFERAESEGPIVRDKRRIDPETGEVREPQSSAAPPSAGSPESYVGAADEPAEPLGAARVAELEAQLAERTSDLQRLQAEYINYKRRVDRDRQVVRDGAVEGVVRLLLPVVDDIGRAREHDELHGGFKAVAESLERTLTGLGLTPYGEVGDAFDPHQHEALMHRHSDDVDGPVCETILQVGFRLGDRILRPARVAVAEPEDYVAPAEPTTSAGAEPASEPEPDEEADAGAGEADASYPAGAAEAGAADGSADD